MSYFLRLIGITNAAIWFGAALCVVAAVWPVFDSPEMAVVLPRSHAGAVARVLLERFFVLQCWCAGIAVGHLLTESIYAGKPLHRWGNFLVLGILGLTLVNGLMLEPKLKRLHLEEYGVRSTAQQRIAAKESMPFWRGLAQVAGWMGVIGLWFYLGDMSGSGGGIRFLSTAKFRG